MKLRPIPPVDIKQSYVKINGSIDLVTPALQISPGTAIDAMNFVPDINGGCKRVGGYERYDGHTSPSAGVYYIAVVVLSVSVAVGATITGVTSGSTAEVIAVPDSTHLVVTRRSAAFTNGETLNVSASPVGTMTSMATGADTKLLDVTYQALVADEYRTSISAVPGSGSVLGVWVYNGKLYAFRTNAGATATVMYVATTSGWTIVTTPALTKDGRYEFVNYNFTGGSSGLMMYGCDGKNKAFQFDGTTYTEITSTASPETPHHIAAHKQRLFLAVFGSMFVSPPGNPTGVWVAVGSTAAEIGIGDTITAMVPIPGDNNTGAMAIYGRNKTAILYGSSTSTWLVAGIAPDAGAIAYTAQFASMAMSLDDRGVTSLAATQNFGNFAAASVSQTVQPFIDDRVGLVVASSVLRSQDQYRLYFSDGTALVFRVNNGRVDAVLPILYPDAVTCIVSGEDIGGEEVVFFGSDNGMVYQAEVGTSFDGTDIEYWYRMAFNAERGPLVKKRWRRAVLELSVPSYASIHCSSEQNYGDISIPIAATALSEVSELNTQPGGGGFWDQFTWDEFTWDSPLISPPTFQLSGTSQNLSLIFWGKDDRSLPFTLQSVVLVYTPRRIQR